MNDTVRFLTEAPCRWHFDPYWTYFLYRYR